MSTWELIREAEKAAGMKQEGTRQEEAQDTTIYKRRNIENQIYLNN